MKYVCGFCFSPTLHEVALIEKTKPEWQKGRLNGIGGKIEMDESSFHAIVREFQEEAGVLNSEWKFLVNMHGKNWSVDFYYTVHDLSELKTMTEEPIVVINVNELYEYRTISNLRWLIPLALQRMNYPEENIVFYPPVEEFCECGMALHPVLGATCLRDDCVGKK